MSKITHVIALQEIRRAQALFQLRALALVLGMPVPEPSKADSSPQTETKDVAA